MAFDPVLKHTGKNFLAENVHQGRESQKIVLLLRLINLESYQQ